MLGFIIGLILLGIALVGWDWMRQRERRKFWFRDYRWFWFDD